tara:strand:+ start:9668 stop:10519 length:852 start_codon:yes stop_codon:yes gene_type:complete
MYKLKQKEGYRKVYNVKLCKGEIFKATTELKDLINRLGEYTDEAIEASEDADELLEKRKRIENRVDNKKLKIRNLKKDLVEYEDVLQKHESGELDEEYTTSYNNKVEEKTIRREKRFEKRTKTNTENKKVSQQFYQNSRQASRETRYTAKQIDYHYKYFIRNSNKVPSYVLRNLKNMPNNKGYIWRGIWFYGERNIPKIRQGDKFVEDKTLKMHELVGKDTFIRYKDMDGKWNVTKKEKTNCRGNNTNNNFRGNNTNNNFRGNNNVRSNNFKRNNKFRKNNKK